MITIPRDVDSREKLLIWFMNFISQEFTIQAILKGGMVLRLLGCQRFTNDLDYIFVPFKSKKEIRPKLETTLNKIKDIEYSISINSKCINCCISYRKIKIQIEGNVAESCPKEAMSNSDLALKYNMRGTILSVMKRETALSHKIAAWIERDLARDLYDIYFFINVLGVKPDKNILIRRLENLVNRAGKKYSMSLGTLIKKVSSAKEDVSDEYLIRELGPILQETDMFGLDLKIKTALHMLSEELQKFNNT